MFQWMGTVTLSSVLSLWIQPGVTSWLMMDERIASEKRVDNFSELDERKRRHYFRWPPPSSWLPPGSRQTYRSQGSPRRPHHIPFFQRCEYDGVVIYLHDYYSPSLYALMITSGSGIVNQLLLIGPLHPHSLVDKVILRMSNSCLDNGEA